jgi:hypothetical protein
MKAKRYSVFIFVLNLFFITNLFSQVTEKCGTFSTEVLSKMGMSCNRPTLYPTSSPIYNIETEHFIIHYTSDEIPPPYNPNDPPSDITTSAYANKIASAAETSWDFQINNLGWQAPPGDGNCGGGLNKYDIYIKHLNYYGETWAETQVNGNGFTSYLVITTGITPPDQSTRRPMTDEEIKITVAHEFNHALQMGYNYTKPITNNSWFYENTSTWMEEIQHPEINDWISTFLNQNTINPLTNPNLNIDNSSFFYSGALFCHLLSRWVNNNLIKNIWVYSSASNNSFLNDINTVLVNNGENLKNALKRYAVWRYFTGTRDDGFHFPKGNLYPTSKDLHIYYNGIGNGNSSPDNLSSRGGTSYITFKNAEGPINISFDGQNNIEFTAIAFNKRIYFNNTENYFTLNSSNDGVVNNISCIGEDYAILIPVITDWQNLQTNLTYNYNSTLGNGIFTSFWNEKENLNLGGILSVQMTSTIPSGQSCNLAAQIPYRSKTYTERFSNIEGKIVKHNNWNNINANLFLNYDFVPSSLNSRQSAKFNFLEYSRIESQIDGQVIPNAGYFQFNDPWYIKSDDTQPGDYWIPCISIYEPNGKDGAIEKGVFLNQDQSFNPNIPNYSVKTDASYDAPLYITGNSNGRNHKFYFKGWSGTEVQFENSNALQTGVVFKDDVPGTDPLVKANFKGTQLSNKEEGYQTSSQRKFIRTDDGNLHSVYESMGKAWYEISTDNGLTWQIANNGQPLSGSAEAKLPAIDYTGSFVVIVWQEKNGGAYDIKAAKFSSGIKMYGATIFMDIDLPYSSSTNPLVAIDGEGRILFLWKRDVGLVFSYGVLNSTVWNQFDFDAIPSTNANSINPTIVADKDYNLIPAEYHLAWEQPAGSYSYIKYFELYRDGYNNIQPRTSSPETPSDGAGFWTNRKPSIIVLNDHTPRLVWIGYTPWYGSRTVLRAKLTNDLWSSTIYNYSSYSTESTSINRTNDNNYAFAFNSINNGYQNKYVKNPTLYTIRNLNTTGKDIQVCNGTNLQLMAAMVFNRTALPYYFTKSTTDFSSNLLDGGGGLNKITQNDTIITFGRSGIASINNIEFVFNIGDILVGDSIIKFIDTPDTLVYSSTDELNQQTKTNNFSLTPTTNFYFSNIYSVLQISDSDTALTISDAVNFKAELVNANTNHVVGTFDNITYNKFNLEKYASIDYEVNCSGITTGEYYLRLVTNVNGNAKYSLANIISDNTTLAKKNFNKVNFMGSKIPVTYALAQNYPNPFNPNTTIRYQIPQDGIVTLKIYDILGSEIATLVNEEKLAGKYEVNFNASSLASGVYIYKIQSGTFINSKKMILLK